MKSAHLTVLLVGSMERKKTESHRHPPAWTEEKNGHMISSGYAMNESKRQISASTDMLSMPQGHHSHKENEPMEDEFLEEEGRL